MSTHESDTHKKGCARCPRFDYCNAPVCPLDTDWHRAQYLEGEPVCGLLRELVKDGGEARLRGCLPSLLVDTLAEVCPKVSARWGRIRSALRRASQTGSKLEAIGRVAPKTNPRAASDLPAPATPAPDGIPVHGMRELQRGADAKTEGTR